MLPQGIFAVLQLVQFCFVVLFRSQHLFLPDGTQLLDHFIGFHRPRTLVHADSGSGFIDQVDCLVRQETLGNIAFGEIGCGFQCVVRDDQLVMVFIFRTDTAQDLNRFLNRRFPNRNRLETPLQRRIFFDVAAVFICRRGANDLDLTTGKSRLEDVCGIHGRTA